MRNPKYHIYLTPDERRTVINSLIDLRNYLVSQGRYTNIINEMLIKLTNAKAKRSNFVNTSKNNYIFLTRINLLSSMS